MSKLSTKLLKVTMNVAEKSTKTSVNSVCMLFMHQPKLPEISEKLRKR